MGQNTSCCQSQQVANSARANNIPDPGVRFSSDLSMNIGDQSDMNINVQHPPSLNFSNIHSAYQLVHYQKQEQKRYSKAVLIQRMWRSYQRKTKSKCVQGKVQTEKKFEDGIKLQFMDQNQPQFQNGPQTGPKMSYVPSFIGHEQDCNDWAVDNYLEIQGFQGLDNDIYRFWKLESRINFGQNFNLEDQPIYQYADSSIYIGEMEDGERMGKGVLFLPDNSIYETCWKNQKPTGYGRAIYSSHDLYEGDFDEWQRSGIGQLFRHDGGYFEGEWEKGLLHGNGLEIWPDGAKYEGEYVDGKKFGRGIFQWSDGSRYEGEFRENCMSGMGTHTKPDGQKYTGQWIFDMMHGQGDYTWPDGRRYIGQYSENKKHGLGTFEWPLNKKYIGFWENGNMNGRGLVLYYDGRQEEGEWMNGKKIDAYNMLDITTSKNTS